MKEQEKKPKTKYNINFGELTEEDELRIATNFLTALAKIISEREGVIIEVKKVRRKREGEENLGLFKFV